MSLTAIMSTATSGMMAAQTGMRVVSDNIANVNTKGYVRKTVAQSNLISNGMGVGVNIDAIKRATDRFLQSASLNAVSESASASTLASVLDTAQNLFGDPSGENSFFGGLDDIFSAFSKASDDPTSNLQRTQTLVSVGSFLSESARITSSLSSLGKDVDHRVASAVDQVNDLLQQINGLNSDISRAKITGTDATGAENVQSGLIDDLSKLMNIQVSLRNNGGVIVRSTEGLNLAGDGAGVVSYQASETASGFLQVIQAGGGSSPVALNLSSGELKGLLDLRNTELPNLSDQLGEFTSRAADELNRASNAASSAPAPTSLTGRNTGLDATSALSGFTGKTTVAIVDNTGSIQKRVEIDFGLGTMTVNGAAGPAFTSANFVTQLNTALGGLGSASFTNGALSIAATGSNGVAIADDATTPASKTGRGFSHYFGLNDIIKTTGFSPYETGLTATSPHGFTAGDVVSMRIIDAEGGRMRDVNIVVPSGATMQDLLDTLNARNGGVGLYGTFALDSKGQMNFSPYPGSTVSLSVTSDNTARGVGGPSFTELFGVGPAERSTRGERFTVNPAMDEDPNLLPFAKLNLAALPGANALAVGDGRGALAIAKSGDVTTDFSAAGGGVASKTTVLRYAADFGGLIARKAANAASRKDAAEAVAIEVDTQRQSQEGVNLDEELVNLTTYQQAFNASARLIQASKDMFDVLNNMLG